MDTVTKTIRAPWDFYNWLESLSDPRTNDWPLVKSPITILAITFAYVCFAKKIGPKWMEKRKPFRLEPLMTAYNAFMVVATGFIFLYGGSYTYLGQYNWLCEPIDYSDSPSAVVIRKLGWWYMLLRVCEMTDTIFFVLRKKSRHISNLHVIHHSMMPFNIWVGVKFGVASGHNAFFSFLNGFVHVVMYFYYFLASFGPSMNKYLWWKKYLTLLQMGQFVVAFLHGLLPLFFDCGFNAGFCYGILAEALFLLIMFMNFYSETYKPKTSKSPSDTAQLNGKGPEELDPNIQTSRKGGMKEH